MSFIVSEYWILIGADEARVLQILMQGEVWIHCCTLMEFEVRCTCNCDDK